MSEHSLPQKAKPRLTWRDAPYDVRNWYELTGRGPKPDLFYLAHLGVSALPALDYLDPHHDPDLPLLSGPAGLAALYKVRRRLLNEFDVNDTKWRSWEVRWWLLDRYVAERNR